MYFDMSFWSRLLIYILLIVYIQYIQYITSKIDLGAGHRHNCHGNQPQREERGERP